MLRTAGPDDAYALSRLERTAALATLGRIFPPDRYPYPDGDVTARWRLVLGDPTVTTLLAEDGDELIGYAAYDPLSLRHLAVAPDRLGSGLADELYDTVHAAWRHAGLARAVLWVLAENARARRFYERHGWRADGRRQECPWPPHPDELGYALDLPTGDRPEPASSRPVVSGC